MLEQNKYSLEEVKALPDSLVVVIIEGGVYDTTEFLDLHPGGREVLLKHNRRDATKAFQRVSHSNEARAMLRNYQSNYSAHPPVKSSSL
ncbi:MAG: cytochrome b5 domain-containing protein [Pseudomonadales bacterium]|nr:cytochrome b5 domain-containing protein [Pseudomonadales bacterium]